MNSKLRQQYIQESLASLPAGLPYIETEWTSPSNIALVKYWGKSAGQIPNNPSLSFSLHEAVSRTEVRVSPSPNGIFELQYLFEGEVNKSFESRIRAYLEGIFPYFPFIENSSIAVSSQNTFPHSSGIASSASAMSALALCLCSIEEKIRNIYSSKESDNLVTPPKSFNLSHGPDFYQKASFLARLGSGSASRSVYGKFVSWGAVEGYTGTSDDFATQMDSNIGASFQSLCDAILIISPEKKKVSSSEGHKLMDTHPFAGQRYRQAVENFSCLVDAIKNDDVESFIRVTENEALTLHGLMMSSDPGFILLEPATLEIIKKIRQFRQDTGTFLTFTIDAGPNVHMIYPLESRPTIHKFIANELQPLCFNGRWIDDKMGEGPRELNSGHEPEQNI